MCFNDFHCARKYIIYRNEDDMMMAAIQTVIEDVDVAKDNDNDVPYYICILFIPFLLVLLLILCMYIYISIMKCDLLDRTLCAALLSGLYVTLMGNMCNRMQRMNTQHNIE